MAQVTTANVYVVIDKIAEFLNDLKETTIDRHEIETLIDLVDDCQGLVDFVSKLPAVQEEKKIPRLFQSPKDSLHQNRRMTGSTIPCFQAALSSLGADDSIHTLEDGKKYVWRYRKLAWQPIAGE